MVAAEVEWIVAELRRLRGRARSVGVITPFRAQADALEAVLRTFSVAKLQKLDLRVGTVHAFQGNERDHVIASLAVGPDKDGSTWRFRGGLAPVHGFRDPGPPTFHARLSAEPPAGGLLADYLAQADSPPPPPSSGVCSP